MSTYSLNQPMDWETFKSLPTDIQQSYIDILQSRFNVTTATIGKDMFDKTPATLKAHMEKYGLKYIQMKGRNMTAEEREAWKHWLNPEKCEESHENVMEKCEMLPEEPEIPVEMSEKPEALIEKLDVNTLLDQMFNCPKFDPKEKQEFDLSELSAVFSGEFDTERFLRFMTQLPVPEGKVRIRVEVTRE